MAPAGTQAPRLHIVTGKGGTGKTTVASSLALALASGGKRVLVCEVEGRQGIASVFDVAPLPYEERRVAIGPAAGEVFALAIDAESALLEYLDMYYRLGRAGKALDRFGVIDFATTVAPGVRDVVLIGKVYEATRRKANGGPAYDAVVLDAPPTGRIGRVLNVNTEVAGVAKVGPIRNQATSIMALLKSNTTRAHFVSTLEEMPVQEALDGVTQLRGLGIRVGSVIVNRVRRSELAPAQLKAARDGSLDRAQIAAALKEAGLRSDDSTVEGLALEAGRQADRLAVEEEQRDRLVAAGATTVELPDLAEGVDVGSLYELADHLCRSGAF